jgi:septin family protein
VARNEHEAGTKSPVETNKIGAGGEEHGTAKAVVHPKELPAIARPAPVNSGNAKADQKYEAKQTQLINKQTADRENLQRKQDTEHQQKANADQQKLEQKHTQQTQQLAQKHTTQQQALQTHQPQVKAPSSGGQAAGGGGGHRKD